ncbi:MAG TPA: hypothetical protein VIJ14_07350, partial [Rhabdochlamydiaceae bacterium]
TFFASRFDLYRFGVFHHRVRKFDGLFRESLKGVALAYLEKDESPTDPDGNLPPPDISGLWHVLSSACKSETHDKVADYYSQWDDSWLLNILRQEYFSGKPNPILEAQLREILSNKKSYWPLFKRSECFATVDAAFLKCGEKTFSQDKFWNSFKTSTKDRADELRAIAERSRIGKNSSLSSALFLTVLAHEMGGVVTQFIEPALMRLSNDTKLNISHAFFVLKVLKSGIKDLMILTEDGPRHICEVSNIQHALDADAKLFPPFFVFVLPKTKVDPNIRLIRNRFGMYLFEEFEKLINPKNAS